MVEKVKDRLVVTVTQGAEEGGDQELAAAMAAIKIDVQQVVLVKLHLQPRATVRDDAEPVEQLAAGMDGLLETDARRPV